MTFHGLASQVAIKGHFMIHIPGRTYYLEDSSGDQATAELWVQTISSLQARLAEVARESGAEPMSPINPARLAAMDSFRSVDEEMSVRRCGRGATDRP